MAKPAFIRYLPARLKPLGSPAVWIPLTAFTLLGVFAWEYYHNPDWFSRDSITSLTPDSQLTPEEEAQLSELDTLDVLLNGSRAPEGTATVTSQINPDAPDRDKKATETDTSASETAIDFSAYPIPGAASTTTTLTPSQSFIFSESNRPTTGATGSNSSTSGFNFGNGLANTPSPAASSSALAEALERREAELSAIEQSPSSANAPTPLTVNGQRGASGSSAADGSTVLEAPTTANPITSPFIRTTSEMSPPAGTTGYQVPATSSLPAFNIPPQQPTRSPYSPPANSNQFAVPTTPTGQAVPAPAAVAAPVISPQNSGTSSRLYTQPSSIQPEQGPVINPRR